MKLKEKISFETIDAPGHLYITCELKVFLEGVIGNIVAPIIVTSILGVLALL